MEERKRIKTFEFPDGSRYNCRDGLAVLAKLYHLDEAVIRNVKFFQLPNGEKYELDFDYEVDEGNPEIDVFLSEWGAKGGG